MITAPATAQPTQQDRIEAHVASAARSLRFLARVTLLLLILGMAGGLWIGSVLSHAASVSNSPAPATCQSIGGTDPSC